MEDHFKFWNTVSIGIPDTMFLLGKKSSIVFYFYWVIP